MSSSVPTCLLCNCNFKTNESLYNHVSIAHARANKFCCYACARSFHIINSWRKHVRNEHSHFNTVNVNSVPNSAATLVLQETEVADEEFSYEDGLFVIDGDNDDDNCVNPEIDANASFGEFIQNDITKFAAFVFSLPDVTRKRSYQFITAISYFLCGAAFLSFENR